jgi:hypothetical protein
MVVAGQVKGDTAFVEKSRHKFGNFKKTWSIGYWTSHPGLTVLLHLASDCVVLVLYRHTYQCRSVLLSHKSICPNHYSQLWRGTGRSPTIRWAWDSYPKCTTGTKGALFRQEGGL